MTTEEKAKAYDEAVKKLKVLHDDWATTQNRAAKEVEEIFPELAESEDERIRKKLIEAVKGDMIVGGTKDKQFAIAWLEKQGEHANFRNKIQIGDKVTRNEGGVLVNLSQLKRVAKPADVSEKQGEPIDKIVKRATTEKQRALLTESDGDANIDWDTRSLQDVKLLLEYGLDYIKKLEKQGGENPVDVRTTGYWHVEDVEQKSAEWSEEDKDKLNRIYSIIGQAADAHAFSTTCRLIGDKECIELQDFLKSLRPQSQWKKSLATADLENSLCDIQDGFSDTSYEYRTLGEAIEFIRCTEPKPQWKPSDEQMKFVWKYAEQNNYDGKVFTRLYNDLKKLKGE